MAAKVSDVIFNPAVDGIVDRFEIERVEQAPGGQSERVTIAAQVRRPGGAATSKRMVATLRWQGDRWRIAALAGAL